MSVILKIPEGDHATVLLTATFCSLAAHGLLLAAFDWTFLQDNTRHSLEDPGISIELADIAPVSIPELPAQPRQQTETEARMPAPAKAMEEEPAPKKMAKKAGSRKLEPGAKGPARPARASQSGASDPPGPVASKALQTSNPAPTSGVNKPAPDYPELARKRGQEGVVRIRCQVDATGMVTATSVAVSSGHRLLDEAALKAVKKWRFKPAASNGVPVSGSVVVPVEFRLR